MSTKTAPESRVMVTYRAFERLRCRMQHREYHLIFFLLAPFLGASPTTSASILVEFGGNDWAAGCVVAHAISLLCISLAMRYTPHTRIHCAAMLACEAPDPLARNTGVRSQGFQIELAPIQDRESLPRLPLITRCADWRRLRMPRDSATALFAM